MLKSGGKLVIGDLHPDSLIWLSDAPVRMARMISSWDNHFVAGDVPARLPALMKNAGHVVEEVRSLGLTDHMLKPDKMALMLMHLMKHYAFINQHVDKDEAWFEEQQHLAREGRFFFSITQLVIIARKS